MQPSIEIYQSDQQTIEVRLAQDTVWLNLQQLAELFGRDIKTVGKHVNNVFREGGLDKRATVAKFATVQAEGERPVERQVEHYSLDVIISVGYRVKSHQGTQFRIWATQRLKEHLTRGYTLNQHRFEQNAEAGSGLVEIVSRYTQTFLMPTEWNLYTLCRAY